MLSFGFSSRKEATRTPDPYVPNVVRYQLRYFPIMAEGLASALCFIVWSLWIRAPRSDASSERIRHAPS